MDEVKTLLFIAIPSFIKEMPPEGVHNAVAGILNPLKATEFVTCPDFNNLRVQFFSCDDARYVKECFDLIECGIKFEFSAFNLTSRQFEEPQVFFVQRDPCYWEVAPECASMEDKHGHAFPSEAQEVTDPLADVSISSTKC